MDNIIVLRSINPVLSKKLATMLKCSFKLANLIIIPRYFPLFKQLGIIKENFSWVKDDLVRETLSYDYKVVVKNKLEFLFQNRDCKSYKWGTCGPDWDFLKNNCYPGHSGASFAIIMRDLELIFTRGYMYYFWFRSCQTVSKKPT